jgi:ankyrin repeat protein
MVEKESKLKDDFVDEDEEGEEQEEEEISSEQLDDFLFKACKENNYDDAVLYLSKRASPIVEKDGWNPLLWAANNGNESIVRLLIKAGACAPYLNHNQDEITQQASPTKVVTGAGGLEEVYDPFVKPKDAQKVGKYTPL